MPTTRRRLSTATLVVAALGATVLTQAASAASAASPPEIATSAAATERVAVPPLAIRHRTLANGLDVYSVEDHSSPTVAIEVRYRVGSKDDPPGRSGFAHLFEHLMFKRTRNMPSEMMDRLTEDVGGYNNASTNDDFTRYYEVVPSRYLQTLLWAEADRLATLQVDAAALTSERDVVKEEYRQRVDASPYGALYYRFLAESSFLVHPYRRPGIGSLADLDAAALEDVQEFHRTYYRPDDAVLVVVGDFEPSQLDAWVDRYFGAIPRPQRPLSRVTAQEPPRQGERRLVRYRPNVPLPAVAINFLVPPAANEATPVASVAEALLSSGTSSRLYQSLVYQQQVASEAFAFTQLRGDAGTFTLVGIAAGGKTPAEVEQALVAEIERLRSETVPAAELEKVKRQLLAEQLDQLETAAGKASLVAYAAVMEGDAEQANSVVARLEAVRSEEVRAYAQRWFGADNRLVLHYLPEASKPATDAAPAAPAAGAESPPPPGPASSPRLPQPVAQTLANGLQVVAVEKPGVPLASAQLLVRSGAAADPDAQAGLADLTARLLQRGTRTRSATEIATGIESLGGSLDTSAEWDGSVASVTVMVPQLAAALGLLADVVENPAFAADEVDDLRKQRLDELAVDLQQPATLARLAAQREVFGQRPYGHPRGGSPTSLAAIRREDVVAFHSRTYRPDQSVLVIAGALPPAQALALAERTFGSWPRPQDAPPAIPGAGRGAAATNAQEHATAADSAPLRPASVVVVDLPQAGQAAVAVARETMARSEPRWAASQVLNSLFGGGYSSRLNTEVRIKRGLSYGAGSGYDARRLTGYFLATAQTKNESAAEVAGVMLDLLAQLGAAAPTDAELVPRKAALGGDFGRQLETTGGLVGEVGELLLQGMDPGMLSRFLPDVEAVSGEAVRQLAAEQLRPADVHLVVAGDARTFLPALRQRFPDLRVIPATELGASPPPAPSPAAAP